MYGRVTLGKGRGHDWVKLQLLHLLMICVIHLSHTLQILLIATWVAMTIVGLIVLGAIKDSKLKSGNPYKLTHAVDYDGRICGYSSGVKSKPYAYYLPGNVTA